MFNERSRSCDCHDLSVKKYHFAGYMQDYEDYEEKIDSLLKHSRFFMGFR